MSEVRKISDDEFARLNVLKQDAIEIASSLGELNYQKTVLDLQIEDLKNKIKEIRSRESNLFQELQSKYGNVSININNGEF